MNLKEPFGGVVLGSTYRLVVPFSLVYAVYVLTAGEVSPGGGFQAGAVLAVGVVLTKWIRGEKSRFNIKGSTAVALAGLGAFIYAATGWITMLCGGMFLDYTYLPFTWEEQPERHALGILMIEIGVTLAVMMTIIGIMDILINREEYNKDGNH